MKIDNVIIKPVLTEKATQAAQGKTYTFEVSKLANKNQVKTVLESIYGVKVKTVRVSVRKGKVKRVGKRQTSKDMPDRKIAVVTVTEGTINVFPQV